MSFILSVLEAQFKVPTPVAGKPVRRSKRVETPTSGNSVRRSKRVETPTSDTSTRLARRRQNQKAALRSKVSPGMLIMSDSDSDAVESPLNSKVKYHSH